MKWRFSLAYPILALISFAALVVALPIYFISVNSLKKNIEAIELNQTIQAHNIAETAIKNEVDKLAVLSRTLEKHHIFIDALENFNSSGDYDEVKKIIDPISAKLDVGFVKIVDLNEQIIYRYNSSIDADLNIWGVTETLNGQEIIATSRHAEGFAIRAIAPVHNENNHILGAVIVGFIINNEFADRISNLTNVNILIGSLQGVIATSQNINPEITHLCREDSNINEMMLESIKDDSISHKTICEHNEIFYYKRLRIIDEMFSLMVEVDISNEEKLFVMTRRKIAATAGTALIIAWSLGIFFTTTLVKPLKRLRDQGAATVKRITGKTVNVKGGNELDSLVSAFKTMRGSLVRYIVDLRKTKNELDQHRNHLEKIVAERTENLKETNEQLQNEINERELAEQELIYSNKKLNNSNQQLKEFVHVASHDMSEPLRKIIAFTSMLTNSLSGKLNDDEQENFSFVLEGAGKMRKIVESLQTYSELITRENEYQQVNLNIIIEQLKNSDLREKLQETNGELIVPEPLPSIKGDQVQIHQLLWHLIANALKYHKDTFAPQITIRAEKQGYNMVRIEIKDNGIGIKPEYHQSIFAMFHKLQREDKYDGIGVGLAICKRIVELHDGEIGVNSIYEEGTTIWFTLPAFHSPQKSETESTLSHHE